MKDLTPWEFPISVDPGRFLSKDGLTETAKGILRVSDIIFAKHDELIDMSQVPDKGTDETRRLNAVEQFRKVAGAECSVVVERIPEGYTVYRPDSKPLAITIQRIPQSEIVDDTGAGDVFNAAFIYGCLRGLGPENSGKLIRSTLRSHLSNHGRAGFKEFSTASPIIFASHSSLDKKYVEEFIKQFDDTEVTFWLDVSKMPLGVPIKKALREGIRESDFMGLFLTPDSLSSGWVAKEIRWAVQNRVRVIPIRLANVEIPDELKKFHYIDVIRLGSLGAKKDLLNKLPRGSK